MIWPPLEPLCEATPPLEEALPLRGALEAVLHPFLGGDLTRIFEKFQDQVPEGSFSALSALKVSNVGAVLLHAARGEEAKEAPRGQVDEGWLQVFLDEASCAGSDLEKEVWGGLLAMQVRAPGAVSRRSLKSLAAMDLWELEAFRDYVAFAFSFESGWRFVFEGEDARREIWSYGRELDFEHHGVEIGLLGREVMTLNPRLRGLRISYQSCSWCLEPSECAQPESSAFIRYRKYSPFGQQLASAMKCKSFRGYARNLIRGLEASGSIRFVPEESSEPAKS